MYWRNSNVVWIYLMQTTIKYYYFWARSIGYYCPHIKYGEGYVFQFVCSKGGGACSSRFCHQMSSGLRWGPGPVSSPESDPVTGPRVGGGGGGLLEEEGRGREVP